MRQFGGFDHSVVIEVGWRLMQGQKAFVDFPCTLPAGFFLGAKYAFQIFGVKWESLVLLTAVFSLILYFWSLWLLLKIVSGQYHALLLAITIQAMSLLLVSYWWYNPITSAATAVFLLSATFLWHHYHEKSALTSYFCALFLIALMKPNVVGIIVPLVTVVFLFSRPHRIRIIALSALAFAAFLLFLKLNDITLPTLIKGYLAVAQRGISTKQFLQDLSPTEKSLSVAAFILAILPAMFSIFVNFRLLIVRCPWLGLAGIIGGSYGFLTNGELKLVDLVPILVGSLLVAAELRNSPEFKNEDKLELAPYWLRYASALCIILTFSGVAQGVTRWRVMKIGPEAFFQDKLATETFREGFFKGLHTGDIFLEANRQIADVLDKNPNSTVAFGPRMQWGYAAFNKPSPRNQPIWWHPGVSFALANEPMYADRFFEGHHDLLILNKNDVTFFPDYFVQALEDYYAVDQSYSRITVLHRKNL